MVLEEPLRGLIVRYVHQTRCPSDVAIVTVDVEPSPPGATGLTFHDDLPGFPPDYVAALWKGVATALADLDLTATLRLVEAHHHEIDSRPRSFERAGHLLATQIRSRLSIEQPD